MASPGVPPEDLSLPWESTGKSMRSSQLLARAAQQIPRDCKPRESRQPVSPASSLSPSSQRVLQLTKVSPAGLGGTSQTGYRYRSHPAKAFLQGLLDRAHSPSAITSRPDSIKREEYSSGTISTSLSFPFSDLYKMC